MSHYSGLKITLSVQRKTRSYLQLLYIIGKLRYRCLTLPLVRSLGYCAERIQGDCTCQNMASLTVDCLLFLMQLCCKCFVRCRQLVQVMYHLCLMCVCECSAAIEHCNLHSSSWHGQTVHISPIPISDNLTCLALQTLTAFVVRCGAC